MDAHPLIHLSTLLLPFPIPYSLSRFFITASTTAAIPPLKNGDHHLVRFNQGSDPPQAGLIHGREVHLLHLARTHQFR